MISRNSSQIAKLTATDQEFVDLREARAWHPERTAQAFQDRRRRPLLRDGRLLIVAADHPARGALGVQGDHLVMADRYDLLGRLMTALRDPGVDGVLATPDIIDDLALLGALDNKVVVGSMNRGGIKDAVFEMDDRFTAYGISALVRDRLDFAKVLLRINIADPGTVNTLASTADAISAASAAALPIMIEPFMTTRRDKVTVNDLSTQAVIQSVAIAAGLGTSSAYTWLKLPVVAEMERVMAATTLPTLLLGGARSADADQTYERWRDALTLPGVRGLVVGRQLIYPPDGDVAGAVGIAAELVHGSPKSAGSTPKEEV